MALTCLQILKGAAGKLGVLAIGRELTSAQSEQGMEILRSMYLETVGQGLWGPLVDTIVSAATYTAHEQERVVCSSAVTTVTLPTSITTEWCPSQGYIGGSYDYGWSNSSSSAYPRPPRDGALIQVSQTDLNAALTYIYDAPRHEWKSLDSLLVATNAPLSERYGEALKAKLAEAWAPHWGILQLPPSLSKQVATANSLLSHRYDRNARRAVGQYY